MRAATLLLVAGIAGCNGERNAGDTAATQTAARTSTTESSASPLPEPFGPLADAGWPAGSVPEKVLLHDDGETLWAIQLSGERKAIWRHPEASVYEMTVSPDGRRLAIAVGVGARRGKPSSVLYLLEADGSVVTVDITYGSEFVSSPVFLRSPTAPGKPERLYWLRLGESVDDLGRLSSATNVLLPEGRRAIEVPLRYAEAVFDVDGYPGAATFTITLFRQNDTPTRGEVLLNKDFFEATDSGVGLWGYNEPRLNTDSLVGIAWISPTEYVIPYWDAHHPSKYQLRLFRLHCEYLGSHIVYDGNAIDPGGAEVPWTIVPAGPKKVLVLKADDVERLTNNPEVEIPWTIVGIPDGRLTESSLKWDSGPWVWVPPDHNVDPDVRTKCDDHKWVYP